MNNANQHDAAVIMDQISGGRGGAETALPLYGSDKKRAQRRKRKTPTITEAYDILSYAYTYNNRDAPAWYSYWSSSQRHSSAVHTGTRPICSKNDLSWLPSSSNMLETREHLRHGSVGVNRAVDEEAKHNTNTTATDVADALLFDTTSIRSGLLCTR